MPEYLSPAVFIEEVPSGIRPIEGVSTSTAAFVGLTVKGPIGEAVPITSFAAFVERFGGFFNEGFLAFAVRGFFEEGGRSCYVVRTCHYTGAPPAPVALTASENRATTGDATVNALRISAESPGSWGNDLAVTFSLGRTLEELPDPPPIEDADAFKLEVILRGSRLERYPNLSMDETSRFYAPTIVNAASRLVRLKDLVPAGSALTPTNRRPVATTAPLPLATGTGDADGLSSLSAADFVGDPVVHSGLYALDAIDGISLVAIPEAVPRGAHVSGMNYCGQRRDCVYLADAQRLPGSADDVLNYKLAQGTEFGGGNAFNSKYGALYTPWVYVADPRSPQPRLIPPSGLVAGRCAATDTARGVHKAPAGIEDGRLLTALGVQTRFTTADQEKLNPRGVNVIRSLDDVGPVIWGARTTSADPEWRYLNVRRLFLFLEKAIERATTWVVFEPNDRALWNSLVRNVAAFLRLQWRAGALVGETEEQAFYVKCDEETNPPESIALGRVITEIGVAPSRPAEFVIFRITQLPGGSEVAE